MKRNRIILLILVSLALLAIFTLPAFSAPILNSNPGQPVTVYLDFNGLPSEIYIQGTSSSLVYPDLPPPNFTDAQELAIWQWDSSRFAGEDINVTTVDPVITPGKSWSQSVQATQAVRVVFTHSDLSFWNGWQPGTLGFATIGGLYDGFWDGIFDSHTCFVSDIFGLDAATIAGDHEVGHVFGLDHTTDPLSIMTPQVSGLNQVFTAADLAVMNSHVDEGGPHAVTPVPEPSEAAILFMASVAGLTASGRHWR